MNEDFFKNVPLSAFNTFIVNMLFNSYTIECVTLGILKPKDKIPFEKFVKELELEHRISGNYRSDIEGYAIDENKMVVNKEFDYFAKDFMCEAFVMLFINAPVGSAIEDDYCLPDYKDGLREYIKDLYPLFRQIVKTEVQYDIFDIANVVDRQQRRNIQDFLFDVKVKKLKKGRRVSKYFKNIQAVPYYVQRLIERKNGKDILVNNDTDSLDYKLALLSMVDFLNHEHTKLLELKIQQWESSNGK